MALKTPQAPPRYDQDWQTRHNNALEVEDTKNRKLGTDIELTKDRLIIRSPGGLRFKITVSDAGIVSAVAM